MIRYFNRCGSCLAISYARSATTRLARGVQLQVCCGDAGHDPTRIGVLDSVIVCVGCVLLGPSDGQPSRIVGAAGGPKTADRICGRQTQTAGIVVGRGRHVVPSNRILRSIGVLGLRDGANKRRKHFALTRVELIADAVRRNVRELLV